MNHIEVWEEAIVGEPVFVHEDEEYTINYGVKIQKKLDGSLDFWNTRLGGDFYRKLTIDQAMLIYNFGFKIGARMISIETIVAIVNALNKSISEHSKNGKPTDELSSRRKQNLQKIHEYINAIKRHGSYTKMQDDIDEAIAKILNNDI